MTTSAQPGTPELNPPPATVQSRPRRMEILAVLFLLAGVLILT